MNGKLPRHFRGARTALARGACVLTLAALVLPAGAESGAGREPVDGALAGSAQRNLRGLDEGLREEARRMHVPRNGGGGGTVRATEVVFDGVVSPGNSPGCVQSEGNLTFTASAVLVTEIGGYTPCSEHDRIEAGLTLTIQGAQLRVVLLDPFVPVAGDRFEVLRFGTLAGSGFSAVDVSQAVLPAALEWDTSELMVSGELVVSAVPQRESVPVPAWALALLGVLLAWMSRARVARGRRS